MGDEYPWHISVAEGLFDEVMQGIGEQDSPLVLFIKPMSKREVLPTSTSFCPECGAGIVLDAKEIELGQPIDCSKCAMPLEVISIYPIDLDHAIKIWKEEEI